MLKLEVKIAREVQSLIKLNVRAATKLNKIQEMVKETNVIRFDSHTIKKNWGPGKKIPEQVTQQIMAMLAAGIKTKEIQNKMGVSLPSIQKIKERAGLVKKRGLLAA